MSNYKVGSIVFDLGINTKDMMKSINTSAAELTRSYTEPFKGVGKKVAGLLGGVAIGAFTKSCIELGSNLSEVQNVVDTAFKSMNESVNEFSKTAITEFGISEIKAKQYMGTIGAMNNAFGFTEKANLDMAKSVTGLVGDVASFYNLGSDEAFTKLKSIWTGETESLKELGVVMTQTALDEYAMNNGFGMTTSSMTEQMKVMLRYQYVTNALSDAIGDFKKTQDGWANQTRVLELRYESFKATLGQGFINLFTPILRQVNELLAGFEKLAAGFTAFTEELMGKSEAANTLDNLAQSSDNVAGAVDNITSSVKEATKQLAGFDEITKLTEDTGGTESTSESLESLANALSSKVYEETARTTASNIVKALKSGDYASVGTSVRDSLMDGFEVINWDSVYKKASGFGSGLAKFLNGLFASDAEGKNVFSGIGSTIAAALNTAVAAGDGFASDFDFAGFGTSLSNGIVDSVKTFNFKNLEKTSKEWGKGVASTINNAVTPESFAAIGTTVSGILNAKIGGALEFFSTLDGKNLGKSLAKGINTAIKQFDVKDLADTLDALVDDIEGFIEGFFKEISFKDILSKAWDFVTELDIDTITVLIGAIAWKWKSAAVKSAAQAALSTQILGLAGVMEYILPIAVAGYSIKTAHENAKELLNYADLEEIRDTIEQEITNFFGLEENNPLTLTLADSVEFLTIAFGDTKQVTDALQGLWDDICSGDFKFNLLNIVEIPSYNEVRTYLRDLVGLDDEEVSLHGGGSRYFGPTNFVDTNLAGIDMTADLFNKAKIKTKIKMLYKEIQSVWNGLNPHLDVGAKIVTTAKTLWKNHKEEWTKSVNPYVDILAKFKNTASSLWKTFKNSWSVSKKILEIKAEITTKAKELKDKLKSGWNSLKEKFGITTEITSKPKSLFSKFKTEWNKYKTNLGVSTETTTSAASIWNNVKSNWSKLTNKSLNVDISTPNDSDLKSTFEKFADKLKKLFSKLNISFELSPAKNISNIIQNLLKGATTATQQLGKITTSYKKVQAFATGGFPEDGLFMANHGELVGKFANGKTAVANNEQITTGIENASYRGMVRAMSAVNWSSLIVTPTLANVGGQSEDNNMVMDRILDILINQQKNQESQMKVLQAMLKAIEDIDPDLVVDGKKLKDVVVSQINKTTKQTGVCEIII